MADEKDEPGSSLTLRGFARVAIVDRKTGEIVGDTGFVKNKITDIGFRNMICNPIMNLTTAISLISNVTADSTNRAWPGYMALGSTSGISSNNFTGYGTAGAATYGASGGKVTSNHSFVATSEGGTIRATATWTGTLLTADAGINSIAFFHTTQTTANPLSGVTFSASTWSSDQDVKATYELRFSQT